MSGKTLDETLAALNPELHAQFAKLDDVERLRATLVALSGGCAEISTLAGLQAEYAAARDEIQDTASELFGVPISGTISIESIPDESIALIEDALAEGLQHPEFGRHFMRELADGMIEAADGVEQTSALAASFAIGGALAIGASISMILLAAKGRESETEEMTYEDPEYKITYKRKRTAAKAIDTKAALKAFAEGLKAFRLGGGGS